MQKNLFKRIITSIFLLLLLFVVNFSNQIIFILSILIVGLIVFIEASNIFSKLLILEISKKNFLLKKKKNLKFLILNLITFSYIFFIFCNLSYEIYKFQSPIFFFI